MNAKMWRHNKSSLMGNCKRQRGEFSKWQFCSIAAFKLFPECNFCGTRVSLVKWSPLGKCAYFTWLWLFFIFYFIMPLYMLFFIILYSSASDHTSPDVDLKRKQWSPSLCRLDKTNVCLSKRTTLVQLG